MRWTSRGDQREATRWRVSEVAQARESQPWPQRQQQQKRRCMKPRRPSRARCSHTWPWPSLRWLRAPWRDRQNRSVAPLPWPCPIPSSPTTACPGCPVSRGEAPHLTRRSPARSRQRQGDVGSVRTERSTALCFTSRELLIQIHSLIQQINELSLY